MTYETFAANWPQREGELADKLNSMPKYVVSSTLEHPEWTNSTVVNGHAHSANVPASDQLHPAATTYTSSTTSGHAHLLTLTADQLEAIASGGSVTVTSTVSTVTGNHQHDFTFRGKK